MFYHIPKLKPCLKRTATWLFDGPSITFLDIKITPLRCVAVVLTAFAIAAALGLTYYFDPYTHVDDGYLACWISVIAAAFLISQDTPPLPPPPTPESLATVTTISSDEEAAELGVPSAAEAAGEKGSEEPSHTPLEEPSAKEEPPPLARGEDRTQRGLRPPALARPPPHASLPPHAIRRRLRTLLEAEVAKLDEEAHGGCSAHALRNASSSRLIAACTFWRTSPPSGSRPNRATATIASVAWARSG